MDDVIEVLETVVVYYIVDHYDYVCKIYNYGSKTKYKGMLLDETGIKNFKE